MVLNLNQTTKKKIWHQCTWEINCPPKTFPNMGTSGKVIPWNMSTSRFSNCSVCSTFGHEPNALSCLPSTNSWLCYKWQPWRFPWSEPRTKYHSITATTQKKTNIKILVYRILHLHSAVNNFLSKLAICCVYRHVAYHRSAFDISAKFCIVQRHLPSNLCWILFLQLTIIQNTTWW